MSANLKNWKVLRLKPRTEKALASLLESGNIEYYLPVRQVVRRYASKRKTVELPLFGGYIFCALDDAKRRELLPRQQYILRIIDPFSPIRLLRQLVVVRRALKENPALDPKGELKAGQWVRVKNGPMRDMHGWVVRIQSRTKVVLYLDAIGEGVPVTMPGEFLEITGER